MFYREALERLRMEASTPVEAPAPKSTGIISPRIANTSSQNEDPLASSKEWIRRIQMSGQNFRKQAFEKKAKEEALANQQTMLSRIPKVEDKKEEVEEKSSSLPNASKMEVGSSSIPTYTGGENAWSSKTREAAERHGVPADLFLRLVRQESGFKPGVTSSAGAIGLAQLMPGTAAELGVDPNNPDQNLDGGARYLRQQYDKFGNWRLALAAYNAGGGAVEKYGGVPPYKETQNYVASILGS